MTLQAGPVAYPADSPVEEQTDRGQRKHGKEDRDPVPTGNAVRDQQREQGREATHGTDEEAEDAQHRQSPLDAPEARLVTGIPAPKHRADEDDDDQEDHPYSGDRPEHRRFRWQWKRRVVALPQGSQRADSLPRDG